MLKTIEGIYKNGTIELAETPPDISESRVIVTFLESKPAPKTGQMMQFGMFSGAIQSTEEDFRLAEFDDSTDGILYDAQ